MHGRQSGRSHTLTCAHSYDSPKGLLSSISTASLWLMISVTISRLYRRLSFLCPYAFPLLDVGTWTHGHNQTETQRIYLPPTIGSGFPMEFHLVTIRSPSLTCLYSRPGLRRSYVPTSRCYSAFLEREISWYTHHCPSCGASTSTIFFPSIADHLPQIVHHT